MKKISISLLIIVIAFAVASCGKRITKTYVDDQKKILLPYYNENFQEALQQASIALDNIAKNTKQDYYLALLERGKIAIDAGAWDIAIKDLQIAEKRFLDIEGTISLKEEGSSLFLDDTTKEYEAEPLEKIMISPYLALAYLGKGDFGGARVERNRAMNKIHDYIERTEKSEYLENPFARYISAIIYEKEGKNQDAQIELKKIQKTKPYLKDFAAKELLEMNKKGQKKADIVAFIDLGRSPMKFEKSHKAQINNVWLSAVYAEFRARNYTVKKCKILVDGKEAGESISLTPISPIVLEQYKKNEPALVKSVLARLAVKGGTQVAGQALQKSDNSTVKVIGLAADIFGKASSAIERADLRCWLSLPSEVQMFRARALEEGKHKVQLVYLSVTGAEIGRSVEKEIEVKNGDISVVHFRVVK